MCVNDSEVTNRSKESPVILFDGLLGRVLLLPCRRVEAFVFGSAFGPSVPGRVHENKATPERQPNVHNFEQHAIAKENVQPKALQ